MKMKYMFNDQVCTLIETDDIQKTVSITNFTNNVLRRAFGNNEHPTYEEYEAFLESRCIPRTRDKLKWYLEEIGIQSYNPLAIIEKTQGRMAEDKHWIELEEE